MSFHGVQIGHFGGITIRINHMIPLGFSALKVSVFWMMWHNCDSIFGGLLYFTGTEVERRHLQRKPAPKNEGDMYDEDLAGYDDAGWLADRGCCSSGRHAAQGSAARGPVLHRLDRFLCVRLRRL